MTRRINESNITKRWKLTLFFSASENKAEEVEKTILETALCIPGFRPTARLVEARG